MRGDQTPTIQEDVIFRPHDQLQLFDNIVVNDTIIHHSDAVACAPFRKFGLYVYIDSTLDPTDIHIKVEFLDEQSNQWYRHKQGLFAALFYEDTDTALGIWECFVGDVAGRFMRVSLLADGTNATHYFTTSIAVDFWN